MWAIFGMRQSTKYILTVVVAIFFASMVIHLSEKQEMKSLSTHQTESLIIDKHHCKNLFFGQGTSDKNKLICFVLMIVAESGTGIVEHSSSEQCFCSICELSYLYNKKDLFTQELSAEPEPYADRTIRYIYALRKIIV